MVWSDGSLDLDQIPVGGRRAVRRGKASDERGTNQDGGAGRFPVPFRLMMVVLVRVRRRV